MGLFDIEFNMMAVGLSAGFWILEGVIMKYSGTFKILPWQQSAMIVVLSLPAIYGIVVWQLNK